MLGIIVATCSEGALSGVSSPSEKLPFDDPRLDTAKMAQLRAFEEGGCAISAPDSGGVVRAVTMPRHRLPFKVAPITRDKVTGLTDAYGVSMTMKTPDGTPVTLECLLSRTTSFADLANALQHSDSALWRSIFSTVKRAHVVPSPNERKPLSREAEAFKAGMSSKPSTMPRATRDEICKDVVIYWSWHNDESWVIVHITITICEQAGPAMFWWFDNPQYGSDPYVIVDANRYNIQQLDTVSFEARWVAGTGFPTILGWQWNPAEGTVDPWTTVQPCLNTGPYCRARIHGTGTMMFKILVNDEIVSGYVPITARVPDFPGTEGQDDLPGTEDWPSPEAEERASGPFAPLTAAPLWTGQITATQSMNILVRGIVSGEWRYTQGCAHCGPEPRPNTEPAVDLVNKYGDCSDFVWVAVGSELGPYGWHHRKMATSEYNSYSAQTLAGLGFVEVDSASVRPGDIVNMTNIGGSGHIGLFVGWGVGGHPIGWANNGKPAKPTRANVDGQTKNFDFTPPAGMHTKFFRPILP